MAQRALLALLVLGVFLLVARRSVARAWRPLLAELLALLAIDLLRLASAPRAAASIAWWALDAGLVLLWPAALALPLLPRVAPRPLCDALFLAYALLLPLGALLLPLPASSYHAALRTPRWACAALWVGAAARAWRRPPPAPTRLPHAAALILAGAHTAGLAAGAWVDPAPAWWLARVASVAAYLIVGVVLLVAAARRL